MSVFVKAYIGIITVVVTDDVLLACRVVQAGGAVVTAEQFLKGI